MHKPNYYIASVSGGKDSIAMALRIIEEKLTLNELVFCDTGLEYDHVYSTIQKLQQYTDIPVVTIKSQISFEEYLLNFTFKNGNRVKFPGHNNRWCTNLLKIQVINKYLREKRQNYVIYQYIGIAADEPKRVKDNPKLIYPLVEWGMTEADCLKYCYSKGFDFDNFYQNHKRCGCYLCPLSSLEDLRILRHDYRDKWNHILELEKKSGCKFLHNISAKQLDLRFWLEDMYKLNGKKPSMRNKEFIDNLRRIGYYD